ncbi:endonuclease [Bacillus sp. FJAT-18017]|jgi:putative endonuclease|uniref:GIY-YIG nuclease family protein n=1 Tax=unclassified Bacillus (in: firmicutes) TaxID=185979 RepID=UPI0005C6EDF8|nr:MULTISPECIES: GIY-YIG nuclease family protein [unclassified Bacillus (in: firmicutes)]ALC88477.1 endonuclease [Bacillus sp. FJAT-18017]
MEETNHYFYVLSCRDGSFYGGYTNNLARRVQLHNQGKGAKYTRARVPVTLLFAKSFPTKTEAMQAEYRFKQLSRQKKEEFLANEKGEDYVAAKKL